MTISMHAMSIETFAPMLRSLSEILDKGEEHARAKSLDPAVLAEGKLAPDMFNLIKQVQIACDFANSAAARLNGLEPPKAKNDERTLGELKHLIESTIRSLNEVRPADLDGSEKLEISIKIPDGSARFEMSGLEYLRDWALPHFYFHVVTAYDILRHAGVEIGKKDYLSNVGKYMRQN
jgi:hypothetical protein